MLEQILTKLFREVFPLVDMVNLSLINGCLPQELKAAVLKPLLKKPCLDQDDLITIISHIRTEEF